MSILIPYLPSADFALDTQGRIACMLTPEKPLLTNLLSGFREEDKSGEKNQSDLVERSFSCFSDGGDFLAQKDAPAGEGHPLIALSLTAID